MKNIIRVIILALATVTIISSCKKDRTVNYPILGFDDEAGYVFSNTKVAKNSIPRIKLVVQKGDALLSSFYFLINDSVSTMSNAKITGFVSSEIVALNSSVTLLSEDKLSFTLTIFPNTNFSEGEYKWSFVIVDDKGLETKRDIRLTIEEVFASDSLIVSLK